MYLDGFGTYVVCFNFKVDPERQIFLTNFSGQFYLLLEFLPEIG